MYINYFGLQELPFSIAPNPQFLFMSDRHREALSHLTYGLGETGGFVLLTGEVGTGKTTVSRCLLEQLPENTQVAFILNPTLTAQELLATICDELKVRYRKTGATLKTLTDKIQEKLLKNHEMNINTILIIDEAQHLQPEVLEQLRLLTNLETNTKKLLQVILIGQPELQQLLQRQDLRQLAQRITARYHLLPLTKQEVVQYIKHRLDIAKSPRMLFNNNAVNLIHKLSKGIPRLINLLCDRALLRAYNQNQTLVNKKTVQQASYEALGQQEQQPKWSQASVFKIVSLTAILITTIVSSALFIGFWLANQYNQPAYVPKNQVIAQPQQVTPQPTTNDTSSNTQLEQKVSDSSTEVQTVEVLSKTTKLAKEQREKISIPPIAGPKTQAKKIVESTEMLVIDNTPKRAENFEVEAQEGVSDELLTLFQAAIKETENLNLNEMEQAKSNTPTSNKDENETLTKIPLLTDMPLSIQNSIPELHFEMHIYASDGQGWIRVNGEEKNEGDMIATDLELISIERQSVVMSYQGNAFSLPSLSSWQ